MDMLGLMPQKCKHGLQPCCNGAKKSTPWAEGSFNTEYRNQFVDKEVPARAGCKPLGDSGVLPSGSFQGGTTYGDAMKVFQVARPGLCIPTNSQGIEGLAFNGESTYRDSFGPKGVPYRKAQPPQAQPVQTGAFDGTTTYGGAFPLRSVPAPPAPIVRPNAAVESGPFMGESLYKSTYTKMGDATRKPKRPMGDSDLFPPGRFDDGTMYRTTYTPKEAAPHHKDPCCHECCDGC